MALYCKSALFEEYFGVKLNTWQCDQHRSKKHLLCKTCLEIVCQEEFLSAKYSTWHTHERQSVLDTVDLEDNSSSSAQVERPKRARAKYDGSEDQPLEEEITKMSSQQIVKEMRVMLSELERRLCD